MIVPGRHTPARPQSQQNVSIGVILAVPLTALITSFILVKDKKPKAPCGSKPEDKKLPKEVQ